MHNLINKREIQLLKILFKMERMSLVLDYIMHIYPLIKYINQLENIDKLLFIKNH